MTYDSIIAKAQETLNDSGAVRWTKANLVKWAYLGVKAICDAKPNAYTVTENVTLAAGSKQAFPAAAQQIVDAGRNMGANGATPGTIPVLGATAKHKLLFPAFQSGTADGAVKFVLYDPKDPDTFYVDPPQPTPAHQLELVLAKIPAAPADENATFPLDDSYEGPIYHYVLFQAFSKETAEGSPAKAGAHRQVFYEATGIKAQAEG